MSDDITFGRVSGDVGINVSVVGADAAIAQISRISQALNGIVRGDNLSKYWKSQEALINDVANAASRFSKLHTSENAKELVNSFNALQGIAGNSAPSLFKNFDSILKPLQDAQKTVGSVVGGLSPEAFRSAFEAFSSLQAAGTNLEGVFQRLNTSADTQALQESVRQLSVQLSVARNDAESLRQELDTYKDASGISAMEEKVREAEGALESLRDKMENEFRSFLRGNNIADVSPDTIWGGMKENFEDYIYKIREGTMTAKEAISQFKIEYSHLFENGTSGVGTEQIQALEEKMTSLLSKFQELSDVVRNAGSASGSAGISTLQPIVDVLNRFAQSGGEADGSIEKTTSSLTEFLSIIRDIGSGGVENLSALSKVFDLIGRLHAVNVNTSSFKNLVEPLKSISEIQNLSNLVLLSNVDFTGFNNLHVTKTSLNNLATYLEQIARVDPGKLKELSTVDFSNFNSDKFKVNKGSLESLANMANAFNEPLQALARAMELIAPLMDQKSAQVSDSLSTEQQAVKSLDGAYESHAAAVSTATAAETQKANASDKLSDSLNKESSAADKASGSAERDAEAVRAGVQAYNNASNAVKAYYTLLKGVAKNNLKRSDLVIGDDGKWTSQSGKYADLAAKLNEAKTAFENFTSAEQQSAMTSAQRTALNKQMEDSAKDYALVLEDVSAKSLQMAEGLGKSLDGGAAGVKLDELIAKYRELSTITPELAQKMEQLQSAAAVLKSSDSSTEQKITAFQQYKQVLQDVTSLINQQAKADKAAASAEKSQTAATLNRINMMGKLETLLGNIETAQSKVSKSSDTYAGLEELRNQVSGLINELNNIPPGGNIDKIKTSAADCAEKFASFNREIRNTHSGVSQLESRFVYMFGLANVIMMATRKLKEMAKTAIELDSAMTNLRIVTDNSNSDYEAYGKTVAQTAQDIGGNIKDLIDSTTVFARLGYSLDESSGLAKYTAMLTNVGNVDVSTAQDALTAITKAFKDVDSSNIESAMDKMVIVGNNFPISVSQIAEGMNNAGSALAAAGNSFDQSVALLTAANTTIQNVSKSSTGLRTITARIRKTKVELDDLGETVEEAKYQEILDMLTGKGVQLTSGGEFRSTYDILKDIAGIWDKLSSMEKASVAEQLAGNRQQNVFYSLIEQFQEAENAMVAMENSTGALQNSYNEFLDSAQAHINSLKAAGTSLANTLFDTTFISELADAGTALLNVLTSIADVLNRIGGIAPLITATFSALMVKALPAVLKTYAGLFTKTTAPIAIATGALTAIAGLVRYQKKARAEAAENASQSAREYSTQTDTVTEETGKYIQRVQELKESIASGELSTVELYSAESELLSIQDELAEKFGVQASQLALLSENAETAAQKIRDLAIASKQASANDFLTSNAAQIKEATEQMERERAYSATVGIGSLKTNESEAHQVDRDLLSEVRGILAQYNIELEESILGTKGKVGMGYGYGLRMLNTNAKDAKKNALAAAEALRDYEYKHGVNLSELFTGKAVDDLFDVALGKIVNKADETLQAYGETYDTAANARQVSELLKLSEGGHVDLTVRPIVDTAYLKKAGWKNVGEGFATVFSSTYSDENGTVAINFTPIMTDGAGNMTGVLSPEELQNYAEGVIAGTRTDDLNLQIGGVFVTDDENDAISKAVEAAERIHELQEDYFNIDEFSAVKETAKEQRSTAQIQEDINRVRAEIDAIVSVEKAQEALSKSELEAQEVFSDQATAAKDAADAVKVYAEGLTESASKADAAAEAAEKLADSTRLNAKQLRTEAGIAMAAAKGPEARYASALDKVTAAKKAYDEQTALSNQTDADHTAALHNLAMEAERTFNGTRNVLSLSTEAMQEFFDTAKTGTHFIEGAESTFAFRITPYLEDGTKLSQKAINKYIRDYLDFSGTEQDLKDSDALKLIVDLDTGGLIASADVIERVGSAMDSLKNSLHGNWGEKFSQITDLDVFEKIFGGIDSEKIIFERPSTAEGDYKTYAIHVTPYTPDGKRIMNAWDFQNYIDNLVYDKGPDALLASDTEGVIVDLEVGWDKRAINERIGELKSYINANSFGHYQGTILNGGLEIEFPQDAVDLENEKSELSKLYSMLSLQSVDEARDAVRNVFADAAGDDIITYFRTLSSVAADPSKIDQNLAKVGALFDEYMAAWGKDTERQAALTSAKANFDAADTAFLDAQEEYFSAKAKADEALKRYTEAQEEADAARANSNELSVAAAYAHLKESEALRKYEAAITKAAAAESKAATARSEAIDASEELAKVQKEAADSTGKLGDLYKELEYYYGEYAEAHAREEAAEQAAIAARNANIRSLTTLKGELATATQALEAYNKAVEGEHGEVADSYKSAYDKFYEDWKSGKTGSKAVQAAVELFIPENTLRKLNYDIGEAGKLLYSDVYRKIFHNVDEDGKEVGDVATNFVKAMQDLGAYKLKDIVDFDYDKGQLTFAYSSLKDLASVMGLTESACAALLDTLDLYGVEVMMSGEETKALAKELGIMPGRVQSSKEEITGLAKQLAEAGNSSTDINRILKSLESAGFIDLSKVGDGLGDIIKSVEKFYEEPPEEPDVTINVDSTQVDEAQSKLATLEATQISPKKVSIVYYDPGYKPKSGSMSTSGAVEAAEAAGGISGGGPTLVNELGPELISDNGRAFIAGNGKPTVVDLSKGAIVINAKDTKRALRGHGLPRALPFRAAANGNFRLTDSGSGNKDAVAAAVWEALYRTLTNKNPKASKLPLTANTSLTQKKNKGGGGGAGSGGQAQKEATEVMDWIEVAIDRIERKIEDLARIADSTFKRLADRLKENKNEISEITKEIDIQQKGYDRYLKEANAVGLNDSLAKLVRDGTIDINKYDKDTKKLIDDYKKWYDKALDCSKAVGELHEKLAELYEARFQMVQTDYENQLSELEHQVSMTEKNIDMVEKRGYLKNTEFYQKLMSIQESSAEKLRKELDDLNKYFKEAMDSGEIQEYSESWYSMKQSISDVEESLADANIQLVEYQKTMRSISWEYFDYIQERFSQLSQEADFLIELMQNDKLFEDNGQYTAKGKATVGMRVLNYNAYMAQADAYAKEMQRVQQELAKDPYDTELIKRREELLRLQQESIQSAESEKDAMRSLVEDGINKELDALKKLIEEYNDSIDSAKDLYEYQKKVSEQTGNIAMIEKQLAAYAGDNSEESRMRIQKLNEDLKKAREQLQETERDQNISEQKKLLDDLYNEYEELLTKKLDDVDALMREMIERTNANLDEVREEIRISANEVGYAVSDGMWSVLTSSGFANYDKMFEGLTAVSDYLAHITRTVDAMARASGVVTAYSTGGLVNYTGLAKLHGSPNRPELVLNPGDTENFLKTVGILRNMPGISNISGVSATAGGSTIGQVIVDFNIDHVKDYNDLISQMQSDPKFERLISAITLDRAVGKSSFHKNKIVI